MKNRLVGQKDIEQKVCIILDFVHDQMQNQMSNRRSMFPGNIPWCDEA